MNWQLSGKLQAKEGWCLKGWTEVLKTRLSSGLYTHVYKHGFAVFFLREKQGAIVKALQEFVLL